MLFRSKEDGAIREDFYFRLKVIPLTIPPLRTRREDLPLLVEHFVSRYAARYHKQPLHFTADALELLQQYRFPGNIRELENLVERLVVLFPGREISASQLPSEYRQKKGQGGSEIVQFFHTELPLKEAVREFEANFIQRVLQEEGDNRTSAARRLGISRKNLWEKLSG